MSVTGALGRLRGSISFAGLRTIVLLLAASLSIAGYAYQSFEFAMSPTEGELLTVVRDAAGAPLSDARIAVLTLADTALTSFRAAAPAGGMRVLKEGTYRLRVSHPKFVTQTRLVQIIAGQTSEVRLTMVPRIAATPTPGSIPVPRTPHVNPATRVVSDSVDSVKRFFTR